LGDAEHAETGKECSRASVANTAVGITPEGKMWALNEVGRPFQFQMHSNGQIKSGGMFDTCQGTLQSPVSAHPKYDYHTNETFYHGKELMQRFFAGRIKNGKVLEEVELPVKDGFQRTVNGKEKTAHESLHILWSRRVFGTVESKI